MKGVKSNILNSSQYRGLTYVSNKNKDTKRFIKEYEARIGDYQADTIEGMLTRRGEMLLMVANAGGGKTYTTLATMKKLSDNPENENVRYVIAVPNRNQSNQNEKAYKMFGAKSIVGAKDGSKSIHVNPENRIISCVYDKALEVVEILKSIGHEVVIVLDESHKMIADANFRNKAIANLEDACKRADQSLMMTATPRRCLQYYKYDAIYEMVDRKVKRNIDKFSIVLSDNVTKSLIREVERILSKGDIDCVIEYERYCDTLEEVEPENLIEMLEDKKYKTKRKTEYYIGSEKRPPKVLIRLNSIEEINAMIKAFEEKGIKCEKLTAKEKDGDIFRGIEDKSIIEGEAQVYFCTSVVECGVSLENQEIHLIEVIRGSRDFDIDNSIQFFARARKKIQEGILIVPDYLNKNIRQAIKQQSKDLKVKGVEFDSVKAYSERKKDFSTSINTISLIKDANKYKKYLNDIENKLNKEIEMYIEQENKSANIDYRGLLEKLEMRLERGEEYARVFLKAELENQARNNYGYKSYIASDLDTIEIAIDTKKVVDRAFKSFDSDVLKVNPKELLKLFENKIFYNQIKIIHHDFEEEKTVEDTSNEYEEMINTIKEAKKESKEVKQALQDKARELLKDEEFIKLLDDIVEGNIYKENIREYTDKYSIKDILDFKDSTVYDEYKSLGKIFSKEEVITLMTTKVITKKAIDKRYKQAKRKCKTLTEKQFEETMCIVPKEDELRYLKFSEMNDIAEAKHFIENHNNLGKYKKGLKDKHSAILDVVLPAKTNKEGKLTSVRASKELLMKLYIELVRRDVYEGPKMKKAIKQIEKDAKKYGTSNDLYCDINIKKLEQIYSSNKNNDFKMLNEISKVFKLTTDNYGYKIKSVNKTFDMASIISSIH